MNGGRSTIRALWLLNHRTARDFDVRMLRSLGVGEIFTPKSFPVNSRWGSADVDWSMDAALTIPADELAALNVADWYGNAGEAAWRIANRHFHLAFVGFHLEQLEDITRHFASTILLRAWGHRSTSAFYSDILYRMIGIQCVNRIRNMGDRFWFAHAYERLDGIEHEFLRRRSCYLPLGLADATVNDTWRGNEKRIFFVCPQIGTETYYRSQYESFLRDFTGLAYTVGGPQPVQVPDRNVIGYVPSEMHEENMRRFRLMFYSGTHPFHVHYHPFEAVRAGMPLVFMAGGLLDRLGGEGLPGRCQTVAEARRKAERLLSGDDALAAQIRGTQPRLLAKLRPDTCEPIWRRNFAKVLSSPEKARAVRRAPKIAVIIAQEYRGGTLRAAKSIAAALHVGSRRAGEPADIVLGHIDSATSYPETEFRDLPPDVSRRPYTWQSIDGDAAQRVMRYQGHEIILGSSQFCLPNDRINYFLDCDFWLMISDRFSIPLLPIKPHAFVIFDYIQRYVSMFEDGKDLPFLRAARNASAVIVTSRFTRNDAAQYAGVDPRRIHILPHIAPDFAEQTSSEDRSERYFVWPTNLARHKNHVNSLLALRHYYEEFGGKLSCRITGVETGGLLSSPHPHLEPVKAIFESSPALRRNLVLMGELPDTIYQKTLSAARFLWHTALVDNGTFAAIEAATFGVPTLSTRYPAMEEMAEEYGLKVAWCDANQPRDMAIELRRMEAQADSLRNDLPSRDSLRTKGLAFAARAYWQVVRECL
jgi:glycosyltransferase involved in cell wall biosynthesis